MNVITNNKIPVSQKNAERIYEILGIKIKGYVYLDDPIQTSMDFPKNVTDDNQPKSSK